MNKLAPRKSTARSQENSASSSRWSYPIIAINAARFLTLASIAYAAWRYGGTDTPGLCHLSLALGAAAILALSCKQTFTVGSQRLPVIYFALMLIWVGYAWMQRTTIALWIPAPFHGVLEVQEHWGTESVALLQKAMANLEETSPASPADADQVISPESSANGSQSNAVSSAYAAKEFASVNSEGTRQATVPFMLACAAAILSAVLFNTRKSRLFFLWAVIANASALAFWGIIQKASGGQHILPGVENTFSSGMPFASFIYKNAGAAALLPALAGAAAILYGQSRQRDRRRSSGDYRGQFGGKTTLLETKNLILISLTVLLAVGLVASLSRGAWLAAVLAAIVVSLLSRISFRRREHLIVGSVVSLAMLAVITIVGIRQDIRGRAERVSLDYVTLDQRWPQWVDGFSTALVHFPAGSGLGTYGNATLPNQSSTRGYWFREAHNQYLEVLTESGMIGVTILLVGIGWFALASWRLMRKRSDAEKRSWGLLGIAILVCGGAQSVIDFVLVIPANLILYASLVGIVGAVDRTSAHRSTLRRRSTDSLPNHTATATTDRQEFTHLPALWCSAALLCVVWSYRASAQQLFSERSLAAASVAKFENQPSPKTVSASIAALSAAVDRQPRLASLYQRRANWHLAAYRLAIIEAAKREGSAIEWDDTQLERLFGIVLSQDAENREALVAGLLSTPQLRSSLADGLSDLSAVLSLNPLSPRGHLTSCMLSPLTSMPVKEWIESSAALVNNSSEMLYMNGLFAFQSNQLDLAVDQWSKSLAIDHKYLTPILELSQEKLPTMRVVTDLIPADRPELCVQLVRSTQREPNEANGALYDQAIAESIVRHLQVDNSAESGRKQASIAKIRQLLGDSDAAVLHWEAALKVDTRDPSYRFEYSKSLRRVGRNDDALKQAVLGQTLFPVDRRFESLAARIRQEIRRGNRR